MSTKPFDVQFDDREAILMVQNLLNRIENPRPLLRTIGQYIRKLTVDMFKGGRPDTQAVRGEKWPKLAESTLKAKKAAVVRGTAILAARPLVYTGKMRDSLAAPSSLKIENKGLIYGTGLKSKKGYPYPAIHNIGGKNGRPPKRRWLFLKKEELAQILFSTKEYLEGKLSELKAK